MKSIGRALACLHAQNGRFLYLSDYHCLIKKNPSSCSLSCGQALRLLCFRVAIAIFSHRDCYVFVLQSLSFHATFSVFTPCLGCVSVLFSPVFPSLPLSFSCANMFCLFSFTFFPVTIFKNNLDTIQLSDCCHRAVRPSSRHGQCCPIRAVSDLGPAADQSQMSLYPTPLTLMIFTSGAFASLRRSLVINTCRLRALKKLSSPHNIMSMSRVSTTLL